MYADAVSQEIPGCRCIDREGFHYWARKADSVRNENCIPVLSIARRMVQGISLPTEPGSGQKLGFLADRGR